MGAVTVYARGLKQRTRRTKEELYACARGLLPLYWYSGFRSISSSAGCFAAGADGLCTHGLGAILCKSPVPPGLARLKHHGKRSFLQRRELTVLLPVGRSHHGSVATFLSSSRSKLQCALQGNASQAFSGVAADGHYRQLRITSFSYKDDVPHRFPASFVRWTSGERNNRESDNNKQKVVAHLSEGGGDDKDNESEHIVPWTGSDYDDDSKEEGRRQVGSSCGGQIEKGEQVSFIKESKQGDLGKEGKDAEYRALVARYKVVFQQQVLDWEDIPVSLEVFPYYLSEISRDLLVDCASSHLWQPKYASYGAGLPSSSRRMCLRGPAGTELYQLKLVEALSKNLKASLLVLNSTDLSPHDYGDQEFSSESDVDDSDTEIDHHEDWSANDGTPENREEVHEDNENETSRDGVFKVGALLEFAADSVEEYKQKVLLQEKKAQGDAGHEDPDAEVEQRLRKGDRVKYVGGSGRLARSEQTRICAVKNLTAASGAAHMCSFRQLLKVGQKGRIVSVPKGQTGKVGVQFENLDRRLDDSQRTSRKLEELHRIDALVDWCDLSDLEPDDSPPADPTDEWFAAVEALCEMMSPTRPLLIFLPDPKQWFERAVPSVRRKEFLERVEAKLDQLDGPIAFIASRTNEEEFEFDDKIRLKAHLEDIRSRVVQNMKSPGKWNMPETLGPDDVYELFLNTIKILLPKEERQLREWKKHLHYDKEVLYAKRNLLQLHKVLDLHNMECSELSDVDVFGLNLTNLKAERVVGWARNHHLSLYLFDPPINNGKLMIPRNSMERALTRLRDQDTRKVPHVVKDYKIVAEDEYEKALLMAVIPPNEVGVKFDHIGALENVKNALKELVMLPLQRPELFAKGNLTRPCKGVLLFGPPGTGKTLLAKAVATEAGANFINITGSTITSKWFGDAEKLTKALFSLARKLSPAVIFVDEVDSLLGARGGSSEHEATRKTRNEFMAAWDGLRSKDNERVLVLAATNRPFDLDDAVIRRLPRRILVDLPNLENRVKILRVILAEEELLEGFNFEELARMTDGYSGSDLKNLSIAAAYRPIRELLESEEQQQVKLGTSGNEIQANSSHPSATSTIRGLRLDDFKQAMTQVGASVAFDATSMNELRRWNEQYGEGGNRKKSSFGFGV